MTAEYSSCEDVTGEWGKPCPRCGQVLPKPKPLTSWHASTARARLGYEDPDNRPAMRSPIVVAKSSVVTKPKPTRSAAAPSVAREECGHSMKTGGVCARSKGHRTRHKTREQLDATAGLMRRFRSTQAA